MNKPCSCALSAEQQRMVAEGQRRLLLERESRGLPLDRRSLSNLLRILEPLTAGHLPPASAWELGRR
jgi:hypothetical protein